MNAKDYVDSLFKGYEETAELADFKEELLSNLNAKLETMVRKGMTETAAFEKAKAELGDLSALADEISLQKRRELFQERYLDLRHYMTLPRIAAYILFGLILLGGFIIGPVGYFAAGLYGVPAPGGNNQPLAALFGSLLFSLSAAAGGFTFLGLTQESAARYPMGVKRALWYTLGAALLSGGLVLIPLAYFGTGGPAAPVGALGLCLPFALPALGLLAFLILSEKDRLKPWARERNIREAQYLFASPAAEQRFGLFSAAVWIFAAALFFIGGFTLGFRFSWVVFIIAVGMECLLLALGQKAPLTEPLRTVDKAAPPPTMGS